MNYQDSKLWKNNLAVKTEADPYESTRSRLRISFEKTRSTVVPLVSKIQQELPGLTIHNITHLDALWHVADVMLGEEFELNPLEVYALGISFLLHDAATSSFAFSGGIDEVKKTIQWKDYVAQLGLGDKDLVPGSEQYQIVLFETLRMLHASQAGNLLTQRWKDLNGTERYLLEDVELRNHYGPVVGAIAASHGDDAAAVEAKWAHVAPMSCHSSLNLDANANWTIDRFKIAMVLRCVDAAHIDSQRAPDIEAALCLPTGESAKHWYFQNRLGSIAINSKSQIYWSSVAFPKAEADSWWRCFETCSMIDSEISSSNRLLADNGRKQLKAVGVMGAGDTVVFQENVPVEGWQPIDFNFQVSRVGDIIEKFGGEKLYGKDPEWALRELIQNSADAIRARRINSSKPKHGQIAIEIREQDDGVWLHVSDDGIGMSRYVLTEILLDFGRSLWSDSALRRQWTGLSSKGFSSVGQFGIGFFSAFMLGDEIKVTTWAYGKSIEQQLTLHLRNRVSERPLLIEPNSEDKLSDFGTRVSIRLKQGRKTLLIKDSGFKKSKNHVEEEQLGELVGRLAPAIDIDIVISDGVIQNTCVVAANDWQTIDTESLLKRINPNISKHKLDQANKRLMEIRETDGRLVGRAMFDPDRSVFRDQDCKLVHKGIFAGTCRGIIGILLSGNNIDLARQTAIPIASPAAISEWATAQMLDRSAHESVKFVERAVSLGVDKTDFFVGDRGGEYLTISEIVNLFASKFENELVILGEWPDCPDDISGSDFDDLQLNSNIVDMTYGGTLSRYSFNIPGWLELAFPERDDSPRTVVGVIVKALEKSGVAVDFHNEDRVVGTVNGQDVFGDCIIFHRLALNAG